MYLENAWYVAAWSDEISDGLFERTICERSILLYRTETGQPVALDNICPHRFAPLHMGKLIDDTVQCPYHGLRFDGTGKCVLNPHPGGATPASMAVKAYPVVERHLMIWLWLGDPSLADPSTIPDFSCHDDPDFTNVRGVIQMDAHYELITDNLLDLSHSQFLHEGVLSNNAIAISKVQTREEGTTVWANRWCPGDVAPPAWQVAFDNYPGEVGHWLYMRWDAPAHLLLDVGVTKPGDRREDGVWVYGTDILTPINARSTLYFWALSRNARVDDAGLDDFWRGAIKNAFEGQDKPMIEAQQRNIGDRPFDAMHPKLLTSDTGPVLARRMLARLIKAQQAGEAASIPRPAVRPIAKLLAEGADSREPVEPAV